MNPPGENRTSNVERSAHRLVGNTDRNPPDERVNPHNNNRGFFMAFTWGPHDYSGQKPLCQRWGNIKKKAKGQSKKTAVSEVRKRALERESHGVSETPAEYGKMAAHLNTGLIEYGHRR